MLAHRSSRGFTLVEALVAALLVATALVGAVHLVSVGAAQSLSARRATTARVLAQSKLEHLRALAWRYDPDGAPLSSGDLSVSPARALKEDSAGFFDRLDRFGTSVAADALSHYRRRWAITLLGGDPDTLLLRVCVFDASAGPSGHPDACVWTIRTRRP